MPLAVLLPYCDGDVADLQGVHFYDDARYNVPGDSAFKHTILVMGANHNFYNTIWTPTEFPVGLQMIRVPGTQRLPIRIVVVCQGISA